MEGCTGNALSCVSMTFDVELQIVTVQRYREVVCPYHYHHHHHHHHVRVGEISCSTMIVVRDAEMFIFCMLITYFQHEILLRWQAPGPAMSGVVSQGEERPDKVRSVPAEYLSLHRRVRAKGRVQTNCKNKWED